MRNAIYWVVIIVIHPTDPQARDVSNARNWKLFMGIIMKALVWASTSRKKMLSKRNIRKPPTKILREQVQENPSIDHQNNVWLKQALSPAWSQDGTLRREKHQLRGWLVFGTIGHYIHMFQTPIKTASARQTDNN